MAANSKSRALVGYGKRFVNQIRTTAGTTYTTTGRDATKYIYSLRRAVHVSVYDKNLDDKVRSTLVPDEIIHPVSEEYWAPDPKTGIFGPASEENPAFPGGERGFQCVPESATNEDSVLEQKAFFRPLENLEKPTPP